MCGHINIRTWYEGGDAVISPEQLASWVHIAALELACGRSAAELAVLGSVFTQLGDTLTTISAQKSFLESKEN